LNLHLLCERYLPVQMQLQSPQHPRAKKYNSTTYIDPKRAMSRDLEYCPLNPMRIDPQGQVSSSYTKERSAFFHPQNNTHFCYFLIHLKNLQLLERTCHAS
jgi:hypothetical protein